MSETDYVITIEVSDQGRKVEPDEIKDLIIEAAGPLSRDGVYLVNVLVEEFVA